MVDIELYNKAKDAYYNGYPIMTDIEFDELEKRLGLDNKSYIGSHHNPSYTIKHPFIMGSLSKVQIHEKNGVIDWKEYLSDIYKYIHKRMVNPDCIITPKYDGCSFEAHIVNNKINSISTRGDGEFGRDISDHINSQVLRNVSALNSQIDDDEYVLRGEVLINKDIFYNKYSEFVNPRSFVSGVLNRDYDISDLSFLEMISDLSIVIYDIRYNHEGNWYDTDWNKFDYPDSPTFYYSCTNIDTPEYFEHIYRDFENYRNNRCKYALDGIVIKPQRKYRINELVNERPDDCVAVKFVPQLQETEVVGIEWSIKKSDELNPVIIVKPVIMDGKIVTRASGHNYGYLLENKVSIGTKLILSLAGDIIPFIYKVTDTSAYSPMRLGIPSDIDTIIDGVHLRKVMDANERNKRSFMTSASQLNIPNIGVAASESIYEYIKSKKVDDSIDDFFGIETPEHTIPTNILLVSGDDIDAALGGKSGKNAKKSFQEFINAIRLKDIILSCGYAFCGEKVAERIENYWLNGIEDFSSMASEGYTWALDNKSDKFNNVMNILDALNMDMDSFRKVNTTSIVNYDAVPVILTGEPNDYATKAEFLKCHPEYRLTTSWKEVKILFTNSLESNTSKMQKAREKNIEIRLY